MFQEDKRKRKKYMKEYMNKCKKIIPNVPEEDKEKRKNTKTSKYRYQNMFEEDRQKLALRLSSQVEDQKLLKKYNEIGSKIKNMERKEFDGDLVFADKYLKIKKSYNKKITTNFKDVENNSTKPPKEGIKCVQLSVIMIDSVFKSGNYFKNHVHNLSK